MQVENQTFTFRSCILRRVKNFPTWISCRQSQTYNISKYFVNVYVYRLLHTIIESVIWRGENIHNFIGIFTDINKIFARQHYSVYQFHHIWFAKYCSMKLQKGERELYAWKILCNCMSCKVKKKHFSKFKVSVEILKHINSRMPRC